MGGPGGAFWATLRGNVPERTPTAAPRVNLGVLTSLIGFRLRMAQLAVYEDFLSDAPGPKLPPGLSAIVILIDANPEMMQQQLCEAIRLDKSTFAIMLNRLEGQGLVRRQRSETDRRQNMLRLTKKGASLLKAMLVHVERHERRVFASLSEKERRQLGGLLRKIGEPRRAG
ncbi:MAG TPA: MarR family transcriptional regulator [Polyangiaceae bacterium]|nr:MarR family transcriptional regulator [Polyangiaceae bacterium]